MSLFEDLSRLAEGELSEAEADALRARIQEDPEALAAWSALQAMPRQFEAVLSAPVPEALDAALLGSDVAPRASEGRWRYLAPWALAAALLLWTLLPAPEREVLLITGTERVSGVTTVLAASRLIEVDGVVEISVEPPAALQRAIQAGGEPMKKRDLLSGLVGAVVTVVVIEGSAMVWGDGAGAMTVEAGEVARFGSPGADQPADSRSAPRPQSAARPSDDGAATGALREENEALALRVKFLERVVDDLQVEYLGEAIDWPDAVPERLEPAAFEEEIDDVLETCGIAADLLSVECEEPPCLAVVRGHDGDFWSALPDCDAWTSAYGQGMMVSVDQVSCPGGSSEIMGMLSPTFTNTLGEAEGPEEEENRSKRFGARTTEIATSWQCAD